MFTVRELDIEATDKPSEREETGGNSSPDDLIATCTWEQALARSGCAKEGLLVHRLMICDTHSTQLIISPAMSPYLLDPIGNEKFEVKAAIVITGWDEPSPDSKLATMSILKLQEIGLTDVQLSSFHAAAATPGQLRNKVVLIVQDDAWMSLVHLEPERFSTLHATLTNTSQVIWLSETSSSPCALGEVAPSGLVFGLARTLRQENHGLTFMTLAVDPTSEANLLGSHLESAFLDFFQGESSDTYERELLQVNGLLHIPRVYECRELNQTVHDYSADWLNRSQRFGEQDLKLSVRQPGLLDTLYFEQAPAPEPLDPQEIEVDVKAMGINFRDFLIALGRLDQDKMGTECAGIVRQSGSKCLLRPGASVGFDNIFFTRPDCFLGDRVLVGAPDTFRGRVRCPEKLSVKIPDDMPFTEASAIATNFATVYYALVRVARVARGESILIHSGAGGTGQAAIQVAQFCGAKVYTTVGTSDKKDLLNGLYGIPFDCILNSRDLSFVDDIKRLTRGKGTNLCHF